MNNSKIVTDTNKLREVCKAITNEKPEYMDNLINTMVKLMIENNGCGIAAPQVGVNKKIICRNT
jgi:peptide deformylase